MVDMKICEWENGKKRNEEFLDTLDLKKYVEKSIYVDEIISAIEEDYEDSDVLPKEFGGCVFNWMDQYEVARYLAYRYCKTFREEETVRYILY